MAGLFNLEDLVTAKSADEVRELTQGFDLGDIYRLLGYSDKEDFLDAIIEDTDLSCLCYPCVFEHTIDSKNIIHTKDEALRAIDKQFCGGLFYLNLFEDDDVAAALTDYLPRLTQSIDTALFKQPSEFMLEAFDSARAIDGRTPEGVFSEAKNCLDDGNYIVTAIIESSDTEVTDIDDLRDLIEKYDWRDLFEGYGWTLDLLAKEISFQIEEKEDEYDFEGSFGGYGEYDFEDSFGEYGAEYNGGEFETSWQW